MQDNTRPCREARQLAEAHLTALREKQRELRALEHSISGFIEAADIACRGGSGADCVVLDKLTPPAQG